MKTYLIVRQSDNQRSLATDDGPGFPAILSDPNFICTEIAGLPTGDVVFDESTGKLVNQTPSSKLILSNSDPTKWTSADTNIILDAWAKREGLL